jgi:hypothetical protein
VRPEGLGKLKKFVHFTGYFYTKPIPCAAALRKPSLTDSYKFVLLRSYGIGFTFRESQYEVSACSRVELLCGFPKALETNDAPFSTFPFHNSLSFHRLMLYK